MKFVYRNVNKLIYIIEFTLLYIYIYIFLMVVIQKKILENRILILLFPKQKIVEVDKLISFGNLLPGKSRDLCSQLCPHLWFCPAQNKRCVWNRPRDMVNDIHLTSDNSLSYILPPSQRHVPPETCNGRVCIVCEFFLLIFYLLAESIHPLRTHTTSDYSAKPERDKKTVY